MLLKARTESEELFIMRSLNARMDLPYNEKVHLYNLEKGYEGEVKFDLLAESLLEERYIMNDLLLQVNNSYFQIDTLIISQGLIQLLDIKNFEGDWYLKDEILMAVKTEREYKNPVLQLKRCATLFRQLLQNLKLDYLVDSSVIFINPEFTLYKAPMDQPFLLPTQINHFFQDLNSTPSKLNDGHKTLAQQILSLHQTKNPFVQLPEFDYDHLNKGTLCKTCLTFSLSIESNRLVCVKCGGHETFEQAILRNVAEYKLLFPERRITTPRIYEWCNMNMSKRTFTRVLKKNYTACSVHRHTYYI
ncbi:nuclease-related domain-containing protein [Bacillus sp. MRMR6]|uniref:nuclease-related domain-containing protein n=1 Tax=Bacillus sp. MRMR6 TaxID=1928617 RepID=UPI0009535496|nr:nuclease-related domain-containing protein [Bacillus sp. MRMR6]OLS39242.1 nuclease [Bacillus sp. MRMR6]